MKRLLLIIMLGFCLPQAGNAQHYFNTRTPLHSFATTITSVVPQNGLYYCTSDAWDSVNIVPNDSSMAYTIFGINFSIFDSLGNVIRDTIYQLPGQRNLGAWNNSLYPMPDKGFLLAASTDVDTFGTFYCMLIRYDSIGNVLWTREFDKPFCNDTISSPFWNIMDMKPAGTGEWLIFSDVACAYNSTNQEDFVLTKLDSNFNIEWNKEYGDPHLNDLAGKLYITPTGYLMGGGIDNQLYGSQPSLSYQAEMIMTDTAGNEQWIWQSPISEGEIGTIEDVIQTFDGGYIYCSSNGYSISAGGGDSEITSVGWIEKLDANRNHIWSNSFGSYPTIANYNLLSVIKQLPDSSIVTAGMVTDYNPGDTGAVNYGALIKISNDGNVIWKRKYRIPVDTIEYSIYDTKQTPDGGFVLSGSANQFYPFLHPNQQGWLIRVDSNGCAGPDDPQCNNTGVPPLNPPEMGLTIYPNPAREDLTLTLSVGGEGKYFAGGACNVVVMDMMGETVLKQNFSGNSMIFNVGALAPGVYMLEVMDASKQTFIRKFVKD